MDISKLTIQGFKSFYEKTVFVFGKKMSAIVGPNGSGKSNITEAIRFVLGEQSSKAMRGKDVTDMLFRGIAGKATKAKVEIEFKNTKKNILNFESTDNIFVKNALEKDEVVISRTIYEDGKGVYEMNGVEVRLKDINEFLLYVHLGNKSSWHISQGEADRVLSSNPLERKTIIEDALGLKVYHSRINDAEKKLSKTKENIREASLQRKEILPEIGILGKQVERIKKGKEYKDELLRYATRYLNLKENKIIEEKSRLNSLDSKQLETKLLDIEKKISSFEIELQNTSIGDLEILNNELQKEKRILDILTDEYSRIERKKMENENRLNYAETEEKNVLEELRGIDKELSDIYSVGNDIIFPESSLNKFKEDLGRVILESQKDMDLEKMLTRLENLDLEFKKLLSKGSVVTKDNVKQISYLQSIKNRLQEKISNLSESLGNSKKEIEELAPLMSQTELKLKISRDKKAELEKQILEFNFARTEKERDLQKMIFERSQINLKIGEVKSIESQIINLENELHADKEDLKIYLGNFNITEIVDIVQETDVFVIKRNIERLKIRLEESNVPNPGEIIEKYEALGARDQFLIKEIEDLEKSMFSLETLIIDLKNSLKNDFERGLLHINKIFDDYVKTLFGGGSAAIHVVEVEGRSKKTAIDSGLDAEEEEEELRTGVEVEVTIPKKKVKGLHSLSGGERALVSIALNFAIVNQNPAPFMLLDETDAALDEANSKRYGEILEKLKNSSKLVVITHNRETMHFADQIYGVTLHRDGHSKVLSVSFDDAVEYAK